MAKGENPTQRSKRYAQELKTRKNSFTGKKLTASQAGFRIGVLNERKWGASIFKHKNANAAPNVKSTTVKKNTNKPKSKPRTNKVGLKNFGDDNIPNPDDIHGKYGGRLFPVDDFDYDEYGNIKGHSIGGNLNKFEPD